ncbi:MAG: hypothetical protein U5K73_08625 [Halofilum sp. (in: g-proteobacteria)]|nr:hypothetical protein [Halofilum sp. (in: g-proteobacteria)]
MTTVPDALRQAGVLEPSEIRGYSDKYLASVELVEQIMALLPEEASSCIALKRIWQACFMQPLTGNRHVQDVDGMFLSHEGRAGVVEFKRKYPSRNGLLSLDDGHQKIVSWAQRFALPYRFIVFVHRSGVRSSSPTTP